LSLSTSLAVSLLVAQVVCAEADEDFKAKLLSSTLFMNGITTLLMVTLGIRFVLFIIFIKVKLLKTIVGFAKLVFFFPVFLFEK